jgi:hypothetical protein
VQRSSGERDRVTVSIVDALQLESSKSSSSSNPLGTLSSTKLIHFLAPAQFLPCSSSSRRHIQPSSQASCNSSSFFCRKIVAMAEGIDRKTDGTFSNLLLEKVLLRNIRQDGVHDFERGPSCADFRRHALEGKPPSGHLRIRLRVAFRCPVSSYCPDLQRSRYYCPSTIRNWQDRNLLHQYSSGP